MMVASSTAVPTITDAMCSAFHNAVPMLGSYDEIRIGLRAALALFAPSSDAKYACKYPLCRSEVEQDQIAKEIRTELVDGDVKEAMSDRTLEALQWAKEAFQTLVNDDVPDDLNAGEFACQTLHVIKGILEAPHTGICGSSNPQALCNAEPPSCVTPDGGAQIIQDLIDSHKRDTSECDKNCDIVAGLEAARDALLSAPVHTASR